jgi:hypothetical protein
MADWRGEVVTAWVADAEGNRPQLADDYPGVSWSDVTGQPVTAITPEPNLFSVAITWASQADMDAIAADANYLVLWSEEIVDETG